MRINEEFVTIVHGRVLRCDKQKGPWCSLVALTFRDGSRKGISFPVEELAKVNADHVGAKIIWIQKNDGSNYLKRDSIGIRAFISILFFRLTNLFHVRFYPVR